MVSVKFLPRSPAFACMVAVFACSGLGGCAGARLISRVSHTEISKLAIGEPLWLVRTSRVAEQWSDGKAETRSTEEVLFCVNDAESGPVCEIADVPQIGGAAGHRNKAQEPSRPVVTQPAQQPPAQTAGAAESSRRNQGQRIPADPSDPRTGVCRNHCSRYVEQSGAPVRDSAVRDSLYADCVGACGNNESFMSCLETAPPDMYFIKCSPIIR